MEFPAKRAIVVLILWGLAPNPSAAQREIQKHEIAENASGDEARVATQTLTPDDGLAVIAAALNSSVHLRAKRDCSHLVHTIYARAGFPYSYASSSDLYVGTPDFERVAHPQPGDLIVWHGHVGIVINPSQHVFFSTMRSGPGIDSYDAPDWKRRGQVRFYRYIKGSQAQNASKARDRVLLTHQGK
jgi:cell wall-associated NlpC family hydrolase